MSSEHANLRVWLYRRKAPAEFVPIPLKTWDQWVCGKVPLPPNDDGFVWYVSMTVWTVNRKVVGVHRIHFSKARVTAAGFHDEAMRFEELAVAVESAFPGERERSATSVLVDGTNRFAQRQFRWKPTETDLRALREIVSRRAGQPLQLP